VRYGAQGSFVSQNDATHEERDVSSAQESASQSKKVHFIDAYLRFTNGWAKGTPESRENVENQINSILESDNNFDCVLEHYLSHAYHALIPSRNSYDTDVEGAIWRPSGRQFEHWSTSFYGNEEPTRLEIAPGMVVESFMADWVRNKLPEKFRTFLRDETKWAGARRQIPLIPSFGVERWPEMEKFLENSRCSCSFMYEMLTGYSPVRKCRVEFRNGYTYPVRA